VKDTFVARTEPLRRELLAHCYRMLGSPDEAEDLVQETYLRAWRAYPDFQERSSIRVWLYRIATNACLTALEHRSRRPLPSGLDAPAGDPYAPPGDADLDVPWLRPIADALVTPESADPAVIVAARDSLRLALIAGLQYLPARQRAVLILREVLGFPAAEVAEMLGTSVAAVKSTLQRARARLDEVVPSEEDVDLTEPDEPAARALLEQYIAAFERSDVTILERALRTDASLELLPSRTWFAGRATCVPYISQVLGRPGDWQMRPTRMNGQQAAVVHYRGTPFGVVVLSTTTEGIRKIVAFGFPELATQSA
jgi:RNA polymerase sigma-70 factor (ECF subfamily)